MAGSIYLRKMPTRTRTSQKKKALPPWLLHWFFAQLLLLVAAFIHSATAQDDRCYLSSGGSSETFTVKEDLPVDTIIGTVPITGDPAEAGDIQLSLTQTDSPIFIQPFTKKLILKKRLDKEGVEGANNVVIDIICFRKGTDDPSITIPIRIVVTDANDNAPQFIGAPYSVNVSEVTVVGTTVIQGIRAVDKDQQGPFSTVEYYVVPGPYSDLVAFESRLEGNMVLTAPLDYETLPTFTVRLRAQDQGDPPKNSSTTLTVNVLDADDQNPRFLEDRYTARLPDRTRPGTLLTTSPSPIRAEDPDEGIRATIVYTFNSDSEEYSYFDLHRRRGQVTIRKAIPDDFVMPVTLVLRATQIDNADRYTLTTLTVERDQVPPTEFRFLQTDYVTTVLESAPVNQVILTVHTSKPADKNVRLKILDNPGGEFGIRNSGEVFLVKSLDYEKQQHYSFRVHGEDGKKSTTARVNITVMNVNDHDPEFLQTEYMFSITDSDIRNGAFVGRIEVRDRDVNDTVSLDVEGHFSWLFIITNDSALRVKNVEFLNASTCHLFIVAKDSGVPPRKSSVPVTVQFPDDVVLGSVYRTKKADSSLVLMIVFGVLLGTLLMVIITLAVYILKTKPYRGRLPTVGTNSHPPMNKMSSYITGPPSSNKSTGPQGDGGHQPGVENPIFNMADGQGEEEEGGDRSKRPPPTPATLRTTVKVNGTVGQPSSPPSREREEIAPMSSPLTSFTRNLGNAFSNGKIHNVYWPNGSIPRRVKKLSWEDEQPKRTELDPDVSVTPLGKPSDTPPVPQKQPDLTVYF